MTQEHFADRLVEKIQSTESLLVMGLDPRPGWLPGRLRAEPGTDTSDIAESVRTFDRELIDVAAGRIPAVKIQIAFYEALGIEGLEVFHDTVKRARDAGLLVLIDAKRGDIGTTAQAYASAFLGPVDDASEDPPLTQDGPQFPGDAMTINPLFGSDGLQPFLDAASDHGKGLFALVKTSNPGAADLQDLMTVDDRPVYEHIAETIGELDPGGSSACGYAATGAVVGATQTDALRRIRSILPDHFLLTPGVGAQGGQLDDLSGLVDNEGRGLLVPMSRSIIYAFREEEHPDWKDWKDAVSHRITQWNERLEDVL